MTKDKLCRTCATSTATKLYELKMPMSESYAEKQLLDLLKELIEIEIDMAYEEQMPQQLCAKCTEQLKNAYDFMLQARKTNQRLLEALQPNVKCDNESSRLKDLSMNVVYVEADQLNIKEEIVIEDVHNTLLEQQPETITAEPKQELYLEHHQKEQLHDPLTTLSESKDSLNSEDASDVVDYSCSSSVDDLPLMKRKTQRKLMPYACDQCDQRFRKERAFTLHKRKHLIKSKWLRCPHCQHRFGRQETLELHLKYYCNKASTSEPSKPNAGMLCDSKKAKALDLNLCKPHGYKIIQCMICLKTFTKISQLRLHLNAHSEINAIEMRGTETLKQIADNYYSDIDGETITEKALLERMRKDLSAKHYRHFYSITNQAGYELNLDTSETESDDGNDDVKTEEKFYYKCDLCTQYKFRRKYQLFEHQREQHSWHEAPHTCPRCDARFLSERVLKHHYTTQCRDKHKRIICKKCPLRFRWKHNMKSHYREHRTKLKSFECPQCDRSFNDKKWLTMHIRTEHTDASNLIPCQWCQRVFYRRDYYLKHLKRHGFEEHDLPLAEMLIKATQLPNGNKRICCRICQLEFDSITELRAHILMELKFNLKTHQNYDSLANYSITNEYGFELHLDDSETDDDDPFMGTPYKCEICQVQCRRRFEMFKHQHAMHTLDPLPYECDKCIYKCVSKRLLEHHQRTHCNEAKQFKCQHCSYRFMWQENLELHLQLQHNDIKKTAKDEPTTTAAADILNCPHCERTYVHQSRLNNHIRDVHSDEAGYKEKQEQEKRKYLCSVCGKGFRSPGDMLEHTRTHTGEKPFKCDLCDKSFSRRTNLQLHLRYHTGEKPYHCTVCGKGFVRASKVKEHMVTHRRIKSHN